MSASHPFRCLFTKPGTPSRCLRRSFHPSKSLNARPKPKFPSLKASKLGLVKEVLPDYSKTQKEALAENYTPAQMAVIEAGEAAIDPHDLAEKGAFREDSMRLDYLDDLSTIVPIIDKPVRAPERNHDPNLRLKDEEELIDDFANFVKNSSEDDDNLDWRQFAANQRLTVGKEEAETNPPSSLAPAIPKVYKYRFSHGSTEDDEKAEKAEISSAMRRLMRQTGYALPTIQRFRVKVLVTRRVVNQTKLGKIQSLYFLSVAGNGRGRLGVGEAKTTDAGEGREQSILNAIRNMKPIPRYEDRTIFGDVRGKVGGTELELMTRPPGMYLSLRLHSYIAHVLFDRSISGFGIRCQSRIYEMCKCAGISDLAARVTRSRNPMNTVKGAMQALLSQQLPEDLARARGKKLVDVRKVYYNGNT